MSENKQIKEVFKEIVNAIEFTQEYMKKNSGNIKREKHMNFYKIYHYKWMMLTPKQKYCRIL